MRRSAGLRTVIVATLSALLWGTASPVRAEPRAEPAPRTGVVRVQGHSLVDGGGPFLGLGATYMSALRRCKYDRERLNSDLAFLSGQGFNYIRVLSMVGWKGREIAPAAFTNEDGDAVAAWPDYWRQLRDLVDIAYDRYGIRTEITIFADAQMMPEKADRIAHMDRLLRDVVRGRERKIMLLEVANEGWQNGFPGAEGVAEMREFARYLANRTAVPVAVTSNHQEAFETTYNDSAADIATWHFSRDLRPNQGWEPVYDSWRLGNLPGYPPVSSNEPIGPGSSVASQTDPAHLVMGAAFAYTAGLPMTVFHSDAGVLGETRFEDMPGIRSMRVAKDLLPADLPNWTRNDGLEPAAPFTTFSGGEANRCWSDGATATDGCIRNIGARTGDRFVCVPIGIQPDGLRLKARKAVRLQVYDPLTGNALMTLHKPAGAVFRLPQGPGAYILIGNVEARTASRTERQ
jgi:hypothetical protein